MSYLNISDSNIRETFYVNELNRQILNKRISALEAGVASPGSPIIEDSSYLNSDSHKVRDSFDVQSANMRDLHSRLRQVESKSILLGSGALQVDQRVSDSSLSVSLAAQQAQLDSLKQQRDTLEQLKSDYQDQYHNAVNQLNASAANTNILFEMNQIIGKGRPSIYNPPLWAEGSFSNLSSTGVDFHFNKMTTAVDLCIVEANQTSGEAEISYEQDYYNVGQGASKATRYCITATNWNDDPHNIDNPSYLGHDNSVTINANLFNSGQMTVHLFVVSIYNTWEINWVAGWVFTYS